MSVNIDNIANIPGAQTSAKTSTVLQQKSETIPMVDKAKMERAKQLGIDLARYNELVAQFPGFATASIDKQREIIATSNSASAKSPEKEISSEEPKEIESKKTVSSTGFDKAGYNKKDVAGKIEDCYSELARNIYIHGLGKQNADDKNALQLKTHSEEEWNNLSKDAKKAEVDKLKAFIDKNNVLAKLKKDLTSKFGNKDKEVLADHVMRCIQAANTNESSILDFMALDEYDCADKINDYLYTDNEFGADNLNKADREYLEQNKLLKSEVTKYISEKRGEDIGDNLDMSDVGKYIKYYNLNKEELLYSALKSKQNLTSFEKKQLEYYNKVSNTPTYNNLIKDSKAKNILDLQVEYNALTAKKERGEELSPEQEGTYGILQETLNTDEAKELIQHARTLPTPKTSEEKKIVADYGDFKKSIAGHANGVTEFVLTYNYLNEKTEGMSTKEKGEYIANFMIYNPSPSNARIFGIYMKECPNLLEDIRLVEHAALNVDDMSESQFETSRKPVLTLSRSKNPSDQKRAAFAANSASSILEECKGPEYDGLKVSNSRCNAQIPGADSVLTTNTNATITDPEKATKAQRYVTKGKYATEETHRYTADKAKYFPPDAQYGIVKDVIDASSKATAYIAENDIVSGLAAKAQTPTFEYTHKKIDEYYDGDDAIKYSKALASQIPQCDKDNQLDMHNDIMTSKYSEVQQYAASQISKLDPTVQAEAIQTAYATGNESVIAAASAEVVKCAPDVQQLVAPVIVVQNAMDSDSLSSDDKFKLLNSLNLTSDQIAKLSPKEKREYFTKLFKQASISDKMKMLGTLSGTQQKSAYTLICRYYPEILSSMVEGGKGKSLLDMGLPIDINNKIIGLMKRSTNIQVITQLKEIQADSKFKDFFKDMADKNSQGIDFVTSAFATSPKELKNKKVKGNIDLRV